MDEVTNQSQNYSSFQEDQTVQPNYVESSQTIESPTRQQEDGYLFEIPTMGKKRHVSIYQTSNRERHRLY